MQLNATRSIDMELREALPEAALAQQFAYTFTKKDLQPERAALLAIPDETIMHCHSSNCLNVERHQTCGWSDAQKVPGSHGEFVMRQQPESQEAAVADSNTEESDACSTCYSEVSEEEYWTNQIVAGIQSARSIHKEMEKAFKMQCDANVKIYEQDNKGDWVQMETHTRIYDHLLGHIIRLQAIMQAITLHI